MWYSYITTLAIWVYKEKVVVFADFSNPKTSIFIIIDLIRPVNEWVEIVFSGSQNTEIEHCETLKKLVHKLNFHHLTRLYNILNLVFVYYYTSNLSLQWERGGLCRFFKPQHKYCKSHWLIKSRWRMSRSRIFRTPKCRKWTLSNTQESITQIKLSS
jgi:hypothetical protein